MLLQLPLKRGIGAASSPLASRSSSTGYVRLITTITSTGSPSLSPSWRHLSNPSCQFSPSPRRRNHPCRSSRRHVTTAGSPSPSANQILSPVRNPDTFQTYLSVSSSSRTPLLTLWTASWCSTCRTVLPLVRSLVQSGVGEAEGGVLLAEVEFDAPDLNVAGGDTSPSNIALTYMITSVPTLLSFDAGEAQTETRVTDGRKLSDREFLAEWIRTEARRHGGRGGGGGEGGGAGAIFGGLFGSWKS